MAAMKPPKDLESRIQQSPKRTSNGEPRIGVNAVTWPTYVVFGLALAYPIINARCVRENEKREKSQPKSNRIYQLHWCIGCPAVPHVYLSRMGIFSYLDDRWGLEKLVARY